MSTSRRASTDTMTLHCWVTSDSIETGPDDGCMSMNSRPERSGSPKVVAFGYTTLEIVPLEHCHLMREVLGLPDVVRIEERDQAGARRRDSDIPSRTEAAILLNDVVDAIRKRRDRPFQGRRVRRSIVDDDDLEVGKGLPEHRLQRLRYVRGGVVGRNDDADRGRLHE